MVAHTSDADTSVVTSLPSGKCGSAVSILGKHIHRMRPGEWLFDETVNCYMWLLQMRNNERVHLFNKSRTEGAPEKKPSHFFNSFFFKRLISPAGTAQHHLVERFARGVVRGPAVLELLALAGLLNFKYKGLTRLAPGGVVARQRRGLYAS